MRRGSWIRSSIFFIVDNYIEFLTIASIIGAVVFLNVIGLLLIIPIILVAWLLFNIIEVRETLLQIEENTRCMHDDSFDVDYDVATPANSKKEPAKPKKLADDEQLCPYCGKRIKKSAKKCRFCGKWLDVNAEGVE